MDHRRPRRILDWDDLESRLVPTAIGPPPIPLPSTLVAPIEWTDPNIVANEALFAKQASEGTPNVEFYGDSNIYNFGYWYGGPVWAQKIAPLDAVDFGLPGNTAENLLWQIEDGGELIGAPKVAVVEVGINDLVAQGGSVAYTVGAIESVVQALHERSPSTEIVLMGLLPTSVPTSPLQAEIAQVNAALSSFAPADNTLFIDPGPSLTDATGSIAANFQPDLTSLNAQGFATVANDILPTIGSILAPPPGSVIVPPYVISPVERTDPNILANEALFAKQASEGTPNVEFYGDSITYNFGYWYGAAAWAQKIAPLGAVDFGMPSDTAENVLWRIESGGELVGSPKVAVVGIGINDLYMDERPVPYTVAAIEALVEEMHTLSPATHILLEAVLPAFGPGTPIRLEIAQVDVALSSFAAAHGFAYVDPGPSLTDATGSIAANFNPDMGHPNAQGYAIIANDLLPTIDALLKAPG